MSRSPLFDIFDPNGILQQQAELGMLDDDIDGIIPVKRKPQITDLMPEEEKRGILQNLANLGASGITALGWLLDTPGSLVRGTISGVAEGDPLKGLRGVFASSNDRVSGRDLLRQFGAVGKEDDWINFGAGIATEVLTDPLTLVNPLAWAGKGAISTAGRAVQRTGLLDNAALMANREGKGIREFLRSKTAREFLDATGDPDAMAKFVNAAKGKKLNPDDLLDSPLAGSLEFRIPGTERGYTTGLGSFGDAVAKGMDRFGEGLKTNPYTGAVVNRVTAAFDPTVMGEIDPSKQWRNRGAWADALADERNELQQIAALQRKADKVRASGLPDQQFSSSRIQNAARDMLEANLDPQQMAKLLDQDAISAINATPEWREWVEWSQGRLERAKARAEELGLKLPVAGSAEGTGFFPAQSIFFNNQKLPDLPDRIARTESPWTKGSRLFNLVDNLGRGRQAYTDLERRSETFRRLMGGDFGRDLQGKLIAAQDQQIPGILDDAFQSLGLDPAYSRMNAAPVKYDGLGVTEIEDFLKDPTLIPADKNEWGKRLADLKKQQADADAAAKLKQDALKVQLGDLLRKADTQFADSNIGMFDQSTVNDMARYSVVRARTESSAKVVIDELLNNVSPLPYNAVQGGGQLNLLSAAADMGFDPDSFTKMVQARLGPTVDVANLSINEKVVAGLKKLAPSQATNPDSLLGRAYDSYTNAFKIGALANPAYHTRNLYSGFLANMMGGDANPIANVQNWWAGFKAGKGDYEALYRRIRNAPGFEGLGKEEAIDKFLAESGRNRLSQGFAGDLEGVAEQASKSFYPGGETQRTIPWVGEGGLLYDPSRTWNDWATVRGVQAFDLLKDKEAPSETLNPFLNLHERVGRRVEDANRLGTYISQIQQGASPDAAAAQVFKTQVDYSPRAFTDFERQLKKLIPFYSYTRGIAPLVAENIMYRPGGLQSQSIRAISRLSEPNEDFFLPEHLRQSAAIPLPGFSPSDNLQRVLTNIDLPYEGLVNLFSPGIGNTLTQRMTDSVQKTGMNLLGQLNPAIKAPLEMILNRQLYSGRELSDLYSVLEQDLGPIGRPLEQVLVNAPGGSKINSIYRTLRDERLSPADKALKLLVNNTLGVKFTDIDKQRTERLAARKTLEDLLSTTPGVRTYENLTVPEDALRAMRPEEQKLYLLYKVIQAESAKRARDRKKQALDPLQVLGAIA